jgi:hypothetical protein
MADEENKQAEPSEGGGGASREKPSAPVTEKAVAAAPAKATSQYVITVDNKTGMPTKIETLDAESGQRKELSPHEYAAMAYYCMAYGMAPPTAAMSGVASSSAASPGSAVVTPLIQAYWNGYTDYLKALAPSK